MCKYCNEWPTAELFNNCTKLSKKRDCYPGINVEIMQKDSTLHIGACPDTYEPGWIEAFVDINYCPMCGRKLKDDHFLSPGDNVELEPLSSGMNVRGIYLRETSSSYSILLRGYTKPVKFDKSHYRIIKTGMYVDLVTELSE